MKITPLLVAVLSVFGCATAAEPIAIPKEGGRFTLPMTGLSVTFPARTEGKLELKGSWSLKIGFDSRDVLDEFAEDKLTGGTWVQTGYFDAGGPSATVESTKFTDTWPTTTIEAWDLTWHVRGGYYTFSGDLGRQPAIALAAEREKGQPTLLLQHYFINEGAVSGDEMIRRVKASPMIAAVVKAYRQQRWGVSSPTHAREVTHRDNSIANRPITLPQNGLRVDLPDDGFVWVPDEKPKNNADLLYRLGPTFPEMTLEVLVIEAASIPAAWSSIGLSAPGNGTVIANLPDDWEVGPEVTPSSGKESTIAKQIGGKVLVVGFIGSSITSDASAYNPVLDALARAVEHGSAGK
jgi:hypothetical protein